MSADADSEFSFAEIVAFLQTPYYAKLVQQHNSQVQRERNEVKSRALREQRAQEQRRARAQEQRQAKALQRDAVKEQQERDAAAERQREWDRRVLEGLREQLSDAVADAVSRTNRSEAVDAVDLERLAVRLDVDAVRALLLLKPKPMLAEVRSLVQRHAADAQRERDAAAQAREAAEVAKRLWSEDELSALSKGMARFPGGAPNRWECIQDKFLPGRSAKEIIAKSREIDSLNSAAILKSREAVRSDFEQLQSKNFATASSSAVAAAAAAAAAAPTTAVPVAAAAAASTLAWTADEQGKLEEALKLFPGAATDKARWELIAAHVGRSKRECVDRVRECVSASKQ
jgi:hypothetical protein